MADTPVPANDAQDWDAVASRRAEEALVVDVDGFEGPLDLLLNLARTQKVDLRQISILALTEQYLAFIEKARAMRLELAADYLVMAAWLAYLKSRLLLPPEPGEEGPSAEDLAAHLAYQLERLAAMRDCAARLMGRDRLGQDRFVRGMPESISTARRVVYTAGLIDLLQAYARVRTRDDFRPYAMDRESVFTMEQALDRLRPLIGSAAEWTDLMSFLPQGWETDPKRRRSATAANFAAALELTKAGKVELRQSETFAPIQLKRRD
ncbi:segregation/condensation protein A [Roseibacterium sp. SDUM158016]|uniref:segregation and condensation protein A n=1 Tax=Roseicyclus sediminis TaxID=2980997 RepID=UPI0021CEC9F7|nr:ScpA family protein [Roseibacterium sp. SDUM158016]MCU4653370.1 segregation/condensation protein A [Roseibacterium sp. SDUM158016]